MFNLDVVFEWDSFGDDAVGYPCGSGTFTAMIVLLLDKEQDLPVTHIPHSIVFNTTVTNFESSGFGLFYFLIIF